MIASSKLYLSQSGTTSPGALAPALPFGRGEVGARRDRIGSGAPDDGLGVFRALIWGLPLGLALWVGIITFVRWLV